MTASTLASQLNGREIGSEITRYEECIAKDSRLLVVFGYSDDGAEIRGICHDEVGAPGLICIASDGTLLPAIKPDEVDVLKRHGVYGKALANRSGALNIESAWCADKNGPAWTYKTAAPHSTFDIMEDGEVWCRGIVVQFGDLWGRHGEGMDLWANSVLIMGAFDGPMKTGDMAAVEARIAELSRVLPGTGKI